MTLLTVLNQVSNYIFLTFVTGIPLYGCYKKVKVFDAFILGANDGFTTVMRIFPCLVAMLVAIGMLRASGFFEIVSYLLAPLLLKCGIPAEVLPLALIRPFSGSAANGIMAELIHTYGGNSYIALLAATIMGGTETTFYVVAVYMGSVGITRTRYAILAGLIADLTGITAAIVICHYLFK